MLTEPLMSIPEKSRSGSAVVKPPRKNSLARRLLGAPAVSEFFDGVLLFVLSKEWYDTFATHILKLIPLPYCSEDDSELPCTLEASASSQLSFAVAMLIAAWVVVRLAGWFDESACAGGGSRSLLIIPPMAAMCVGWAFGFAAVKWLEEIDGSVGLFEASPGLANLALSAAATLGAATLIVGCRPSTLGLACGVTPHGLPTTAHRAARAVLGELELVWRLSARALSVVVMMLWTKGLSLMLIEGTAPSMRQGPMYVRMLLFWAISLTMAGSLASLSIIRQRAACVDTLRAGSSTLALILALSLSLTPTLTPTPTLTVTPTLPLTNPHQAAPPVRSSAARRRCPRASCSCSASTPPRCVHTRSRCSSRPSAGRWAAHGPISCWRARASQASRRWR